MRPAHVEWRASLRDLRRRRNLTRSTLADRSGLSADSLRSYELGRRRPTRENLSRLLECLDADQATRNAIFADAGYASDATAGRYAERGLTRREAVAVVHRMKWPALLVGGTNILAVNDPAARVLSVRDLRTKRPAALTQAARRAIGLRCENWDDLVAGTIAAFKATFPDEVSEEGPSPAFAPMFAAYCVGDPLLTRRLKQLWATTPAFQPTYAGRTYNVIWRSAGRARIRFEAIVNCVNTVTGLYVHNWIAVDARSHRLLETLLAG
jgi:transcriptional regulator with XRE-family HTH domain